MSKILIRVNTLAFVALVVLLSTGRAKRMQRGLTMAVAASVALQYLLPLVVDLAMLGWVRVDGTSNKLMMEWEINRRTNDPYLRTKYSDPESFQDYVFVYDPTEVHFDSYSVNYQRRSRTFNSGRRRYTGRVFPGNANLRMISIPATAGVSRGYRQPSGTRHSNFVSGIFAQFFYERAGKSDTEHEEKLAKFRNMKTKGRFMIKKDGVFEDVQRLEGPIRR